MLKPFARTRRYILLIPFLISVAVSASVATPCHAADTGSKSTMPDAALWQALADGDAQGLVAALEAGAYVDSEQAPPEVLAHWGDPPQGVAPLIEAIFYKKTELALLLLSHGADPMARSPRGTTAVQAAILAGDEQVFSTLLAKGADIRSEPADEDIPAQSHLVEFAAIGGSLEIMSAVLAAGHVLPADPQARIELLQSALWGAPPMFEYLVRETGIALSPEIIARLVERAREIRSETFLRYFYRQKYMADSRLGQILTQALQQGMDALAADILGDHPKLWAGDVAEAVGRRIREDDPLPMIDLFSRFGKQNLLLPYLNDLFLYCGLKGDSGKIWSLLETFHIEKSREPALLGHALLGALKHIHFRREWPESGMSDEAQSRYDGLIGKILRRRVDLDLSDEEGRTPLWFAIRNRNADLAGQLLARGAKATPAPGGSPDYLHTVCQIGLEGLVAGLVAAGADLEATDHYGVTPLGRAVEKGHPALVQELLTAGADPNHSVPGLARNPKLFNPFLGAVHSGDAALTAPFLQPREAGKVAPELLERGLIEAITAGHAEILELMLPAIKNIDQPVGASAFSEGKALLIHALEAHQPRMIQPLIAHGARRVPEGYTEADLMCYAVGREGVEMTRALLDAGLHPGVSCGEFPLLIGAVVHGGPELVNLLLERGADIRAAVESGDFKGWTPLMAAVSENKPELVALLARNGADLDATGPGMLEGAGWWQQKPTTMTALMKAAEMGDAGMMRTLMRAGADIDRVNAEGFTALMTAARFGQGGAVKTLLLAGADASVVNAHGNGALGLAAISGDRTVQRLLLGRTGRGERGVALIVAAGLGALDPFDDLLQGDALPAEVLNKALLAAIQAGLNKPQKREAGMTGDEGRTRLKMIAALIAAGADPNNQWRSVTPYLALVDTGYAVAWKKQAAQLLDQLGADINRTIKNRGTSPLMEAARLKEPELAALFLKFGADPCLRDKKGKSALDWADADPEDKTRQVLIQGGALQCRNR